MKQSLGFARQSQTIVHRQGFTLLEILAVLTIMALMVGLAGYSLHGVLHRATHQQTLDAFIAFDAAARDRASRAGRPIRLDFEAQRVVAAWQKTRGVSGQSDLHAGAFPTGYHITMRALGGAPDRNRLAINAQGRSPSYRVKVEAPDGTTRWIVICGLSGQAKVFDDENVVDDISKLAMATALAR